jgi:hypothetical protein
MKGMEQQLINTFYTSFQQGDWKGMLTVYHPAIFFYDPVFGNLEGPQVAAMWEMLLSSAKGLDLGRLWQLLLDSYLSFYFNGEEGRQQG